MRAPVLRPLALAVCLAACVNTDTAVFVVPTIEAPELAIGGGVLGVSLTGSFTLKLHLGARASDTSQVSLGGFAIVDAGKNGAIVESLPLDSATHFPVTVEQDSDETIAMTIDTGAKLLPAELKAKLCAAAGVIVKGTIQDSLQDGATPVYSDVVHPSGCN